jgi:regulatory protein
VNCEKAELQNTADCESAVDSKRINKAIAYACRLLGMREYSRLGLKRKMQSKGYTAFEMSQAVGYLDENHYLSDRRFCEALIRSRVERGQGERRIKQELKSEGIHESNFKELLNSVDWQANCDKICQKKVATLDLSEYDKSRMKLQRFLNYRGFLPEQISFSIKQYFNKGVIVSEYDK